MLRTKYAPPVFRNYHFKKWLTNRLKKLIFTNQGNTIMATFDGDAVLILGKICPATGSK
jgi:hypothetical protein